MVVTPILELKRSVELEIFQHHQTAWRLMKVNGQLKVVAKADTNMTMRVSQNLKYQGLDYNFSD